MPDLPNPPFIPIQGIDNFRSLAPGAQTSNPRGYFRTNYIFRSAEPSHVMASPSGRQTLKSLNISTIYDLRSSPEVEKNRSRVPLYDLESEGVERVFAPIFAEKDYSPEQIARRYRMYGRGGREGFIEAYTAILIHGVGSYGKIFRHVRDRPESPFLIHCSAGKDRTGVLAALILELVGVEDQVIADEYQLTEVGLAHWKETMTEMLLKDDAMEGKREYAENMLGAKAENMLATLALIREKYGGAEGYLKAACGFSDEDISKVRKNLVEAIRKEPL